MVDRRLPSCKPLLLVADVTSRTITCYFTPWLAYKSKRSAKP